MNYCLDSFRVDQTVADQGSDDEKLDYFMRNHVQPIHDDHVASGRDTFTIWTKCFKPMNANDKRTASEVLSDVFLSSDLVKNSKAAKLRDECVDFVKNNRYIMGYQTYNYIPIYQLAKVDDDGQYLRKIPTSCGMLSDGDQVSLGLQVNASFNKTTKKLRIRLSINDIYFYKKHTGMLSSGDDAGEVKHKKVCRPICDADEL